MNKEWFKTWFDTEYYHLLYKHRDDKDANQLIDNLVGKGFIVNDSLVLDIACGKGRHSIYLNSLGMNVTGIDLSEQSIKYANQFSNENLKFSVWDMRKQFANEAYDAVVNLFSSFGYFEDNDEDLTVIRAMHGALKKNGMLILDFMNPEKVIKDMKSKEIIDRGRIQFHIQKRIENGFIVKTIEFLSEGEDYTFQERLKIIKPESFQKMFEIVGFERKELYGNYDLSPFKSSDSPRQIWVMQKV